MLWWVCGASNKGSGGLKRLQGMPIAKVIICGRGSQKAKNGNEMGGTSRIATYRHPTRYGTSLCRTSRVAR
jgi:hypothetical protein